MRKNISKVKICILSMVIIILINFATPISAKDNINFNNISIEDGLTQATVEDMIQDKKGYIWIATNDGLNRYNGNEFKAFRHEKNNENSIVNNYVVELAEDLEGNIWVGTISGLSKINSDGKVIKNYIDDKEKGNLSHYNIWDILVTKAGEVIVTTDDGVNIYNKETDSFDRILNNNLISSQLVRSIDEDDNGNLWLGTNNGLNKINVNEKKVEKFFKDDNKESITENLVNTVYCKDNYTWIGTSTKGLSRIDINTGEIENIFEKIPSDVGEPGESIKDILKDSKGIVWIGTNNGLLEYDEKKDEFTLHKNKIYDDRSLSNDHVHTIMEDRSGILMVGTYSGISCFEINNSMEYYYHDPFDNTTISDNMINGIYKDDEGYLWIGTNSRGINILDSKMDCIKNITKNDSEFLIGNTIRDITGYKENIFIGTNNGLCWINKSTKEVKIINKEDGLVAKNIRDLYIDKEGNLWIGTNEGYNVLNIKTLEIIDITYVLDSINVKDKFCGSMFQDRDGEYWIGSFLNGGLVRINPKTEEIKLYTHDENDKNTIIDNSIRTIAEDSKGYIWVGTSGGLCKINKDKDEITRYSTEDGLPNNTIYGILIDEEDNPWVSTNLGISKYNVKENSFNNLNILDGLQSNEFNGKSYFKDNNGKFYFGGINGLNAFYPNDIINSEVISDVIFDEFFVNGVSVEYIDNKVFKSDENNICIKVFTPDYGNNKNTRFYYNIEGNKDSWVRMKTPEVLFSNLAPGNYNFKIVALNNKGQTSQVKEINFKIKNVFWLSFPAYIIYLALAIILFLYNRYKVKKLDAEVEIRTRELRNEMNKNNELYEKIIKLEKNKNSYFINLSHELRTPLNVSSTTEQLITKLNSEGTISKDKLAYYTSVLRKNNKRLLNLINNLIDISKMEHGKYIINKKEVDIVYLVEEAALSLKDYVEDKKIELIIDPEIEEKIISCDPNDIERCVINLISNAVKFTPEGGTITVGIEIINNIVKITVKDTGIGIEDEFKDKIFDRFNQIVDKNAEVRGGSGLGLTITRQIVDLHKGNIYVESEIGNGSSFIIELPINEVIK